MGGGRGARSRGSTRPFPSDRNGRGVIARKKDRYVDIVPPATCSGIAGGSVLSGPRNDASHSRPSFYQSASRPTPAIMPIRESLGNSLSPIRDRSRHRRRQRGRGASDMPRRPYLLSPNIAPPSQSAACEENAKERRNSVSYWQTFHPASATQTCNGSFGNIGRPVTEDWG